MIWIFSLVILILLTDSGARWIFVQILVTSNKKKKKNVSCDFCIYFFISLMFYVQRWTDFEASSTTRGDVCCVTCLIFDRLPDNQAECPVWLPLHYSFWHYVHSSDFCLLFCSRHQSFRNSQSTSCFSCLSQLMSCQNRCLKLKTKNFWMDVLFGGNILTFNPALRLLFLTVFWFMTHKKFRLSDCLLLLGKC